MSESVLERLTKLKPSEIEDHDLDMVTDYGSVGWHRGVRERALFIDLWFKTGNCVSLAYGTLEKVIYDPSEGITLVFMGTKVVIKGSCLDKPLHGTTTLRDGIVRHRVIWIKEADRDLAAFGSGNQMIISSISI